MYRSSWHLTVLAADSTQHSKAEMDRLNDALGGEVRLQKELVNHVNKIRRYFWMSDLKEFHLELPDDEICNNLYSIMDLVDHHKSVISLNVNISFSYNDSCAGFNISSRIVTAAAAANASIDVPIDYYPEK